MKNLNLYEPPLYYQKVIAAPSVSEVVKYVGSMWIVPIVERVKRERAAPNQ